MKFWPSLFGLAVTACGIIAQPAVEWQRSFGGTLQVAKQSPDNIRRDGFRFRVTGTSNAFYVIEHSSDLKTWTPFRTNGPRRRSGHN